LLIIDDLMADLQSLVAIFGRSL